MAERTCCSIDGCEKVPQARGWCPMHYQRWRAAGDPGGAELIRQPQKGRTCSVDGCETPARKQGWCASHYSQQRRLNQARPLRAPNPPKPFQYKWAEHGQPCVVCGDPVPLGGRRRKHCSNSCQAADSRHRGARPTTATCILCGKDFSLSRRDGRFQRTDTMWCRSCGRESPEANRFKRYGVRPEVYVAALAAGCEICGRAVASLHVDHDHSCCAARTFRTCGQCVRGFLCGDCNRAIGLFRDDQRLLNEAARYLTRTIRAP